MATQTIQFAFLTGQTVTVKLFADDGSDMVLATPTATEATNRTGIYTFTQTDRAAGDYLITVSATGINAEYLVTLTLDTAVFKAYERSDPKLTAIHSKLPSRSYLMGTTESTGQVGPSDLEEIASAVWDDDITSHTTAGTFGGWVQSGLASASDLATVSGKVDTIDDLIDTEVAAIKAKTDNLPADPADASDIAAAFSTVNTKLDAIDDFIDTEVAAIKAKTDNLPADPADASDVAASFSTVNSTLATLAGYVDTEVAAIKVVTDRLSGMLVQDGLVYQFTTNALENGTGGGGGGSTYIVVHPGYASRPEKVAGTTIVLYHEETGTVGPIRVQRRSDDTYSDVDLTDFTGLHVVIKDYEMTEIDDISTVTVSGTGNAQFSFPVSTTVTGTVTADTQEEWHYYSLRDTDGVVICTGRLRVREG